MNKKDYHCSCQSKQVVGKKVTLKPWIMHVTTVDKEQKCTQCGYYATYIEPRENKNGRWASKTK